jgi:hypothetical protein
MDLVILFFNELFEPFGLVHREGGVEDTVGEASIEPKLPESCSIGGGEL